MKFLNSLAIAILGLSLAACQQTTAKLTKEELSQFALTSVDVKIDDKTRIRWGKYKREKERLQALALTAPRQISPETPTPETVAVTETSTSPQQPLTPEDYERETLIRPVQEAYAEKFGAVMTGEKPIRAEVYLRDIFFTPPGLKVVTGGGNTLIADATFIDASSNTVITKTSRVSASGGLQISPLNSPAAAIISRAVNEGRKKEPFEVLAHNLARKTRTSITVIDNEDGNAF